MRFGDLVVEKLGFVVLDLDSYAADLNFVLNYISVDIKGSDDGGALAEPNFVTLNLRL